jgi:hypothetical protein
MKTLLSAALVALSLLAGVVIVAAPASAAGPGVDFSTGQGRWPEA